MKNENIKQVSRASCEKLLLEPRSLCILHSVHLQGKGLSFCCQTQMFSAASSSLGTSQLKNKKWTTSCILWRGFLIYGEVMRSPSHSHYAGIILWPAKYGTSQQIGCTLCLKSQFWIHLGFSLKGRRGWWNFLSNKCTNFWKPQFALITRLRVDLPLLLMCLCPPAGRRQASHSEHHSVATCYQAIKNWLFVFFAGGKERMKMKWADVRRPAKSMWLWIWSTTDQQKW